MPSTVFRINGKNHVLKYARKLPTSEVMKMKSFVTKGGKKLVKKDGFKIKKVENTPDKRLFFVNAISA